MQFRSPRSGYEMRVLVLVKDQGDVETSKEEREAEEGQMKKLRTDVL